MRHLFIRKLSPLDLNSFDHFLLPYRNPSPLLKKWTVFALFM